MHESKMTRARAVSSIPIFCHQLQNMNKVRFGIVLSREDPSNKTSHLVARDLRPHIPKWLLSFWELSKFSPLVRASLHKVRIVRVQLRGICTHRIHLVNKGLRANWLITWLHVQWKQEHNIYSVVIGGKRRNVNLKKNTLKMYTVPAPASMKC